MRPDIPLLRAIRGPVTLITLGALFALNNFTPYRFSETWPVLLIVFGLLSLLGRSSRPQYPPYGAPPPAGYAQGPYTTPPPPRPGDPPPPPFGGSR